MSVKLDLKDRKILYELDLNSRASLGSLAKKVGLSKQVVDYRIRNLKTRGILKNTYAVIAFTKLGFTQYKVYIKLHSATPEKEKEFIDYLTSRKQIVWTSSCRGKWDLAVTIIARDVVEFDSILKEIINNFGRCLLDKDILTVSYSPLYSRNYLLPEKEKQEFLYMKKIENIETDNTEKEIIRILAGDARISIIDIMKKLNLTRDTVTYRLKKLKKEGIVLCYRALIDLEKIDYHLYKLILRLHNFSKEEETRLVTYCKTIPEIGQYLRLVGNWDAEIEFEIESEEKLYKTINEIRNKFDKIIKDYEVLHLVEEYKMNYYPI